MGQNDAECQSKRYRVNYYCQQPLLLSQKNAVKLGINFTPTSREKCMYSSGTVIFRLVVSVTDILVLED